MRRLDQGINFFNSRRYFEAHEAFEDLWREEHGELRPLYQGLVQAAVGLHHLVRGNRLGGESQLRKSLSKLDRYPFGFAGIDLDDLRKKLRQVLTQAEVESVPVIRIVRLKSSPLVLESEGTSGSTRSGSDGQ